MKRLMMILVAAAALLSACGGPTTYTSYEVIRRADRLEAGDDVRVVPVDGGAYQGRVVSVDGDRVTVALSGERERTIAWSEIRVIERVRQVTAK